MVGFDPRMESGYYRYVFTRIPLPISPTSICTANVNRVSLIVVNDSNAYMGLSTTPISLIGGPKNIMLPNLDQYIITWENVGALVTCQWFIIQSTGSDSTRNTAGSSINITEIIYTPN